MSLLTRITGFFEFRTPRLIARDPKVIKQIWHSKKLDCWSENTWFIKVANRLSILVVHRYFCDLYSWIWHDQYFDASSRWQSASNRRVAKRDRASSGVPIQFDVEFLFRETTQIPKKLKRATFNMAIDGGMHIELEPRTGTCLHNAHANIRDWSPLSQFSFHISFLKKLSIKWKWNFVLLRQSSDGYHWTCNRSTNLKCGTVSIERSLQTRH